jgi:uncharacterized protein (TIGR02594 family)
MIEWLKKIWAFIIEALKSAPAPEKPIEPPTMVPKWLEIAKKEIGVREVTGLDHNPRILEYHSKTALKATTDEVSWCSAFVCFIFESCGIRSTRDAWARSWLKWGYPMKSPEMGCVVVLWREHPDSWKGHVGLWTGQDDLYVYVLGGNQNNLVNISKYPKKQVLGYRWPKG